MCIQQQTAMLFVQVFEHLIIVCKVTNDDYSIGVWFIVFNLLLQRYCSGFRSDVSPLFKTY